MKRFLFLLCTLILLPSDVMSQGVGPAPAGVTPPPLNNRLDPRLWENYTINGEEFAVTLPYLPAMTTVKTLHPRLQKHRRQRQLKTTLDGVVYTIDVFENIEPRQSLEDFIAEQNTNSVYDLTTERPVTVDGVSGKEYLSQNKTPPTTTQFFATEKRLFRFSARGAAAENPAVRRFFSSIVLRKDADGIKVSDGPGLPLDFEAARIFTGKEIDVKPRLLEKPEPTYTDEARAQSIAGTVILKGVFSATGQVTNLRVVSGLPYGLTKRAIDAARQIKFVPAMKDGKPVSMWIQLEYNFSP